MYSEGVLIGSFCHAIIKAILEGVGEELVFSPQMAIKE
jgi:hypothetical protein